MNPIDMIEKDPAILDAINDFQKNEQGKTPFQLALENQNKVNKSLEEQAKDANATLQQAFNEKSPIDRRSALDNMERNARINAGLDPNIVRDDIDLDKAASNSLTQSLKQDVENKLHSVHNGPVQESDDYDYEEKNSGIIIDHKDIKLQETKTMNSEAATEEKLHDNVMEYVKEMDDEINALKEAKNVVENEVLDDDEMKEIDDMPVVDDTDYNQLSSGEYNKRYNEAIVLIDKCGIANVNFTPEEEEKLKHARSITLKQVTTKDIKTINVKKKKPKLDEAVRSSLSNFDTVVPLIGSGYTAKLSGCSIYELMAIISTLDEANPIENFNRKTTLIYEKIRETSIGKMTYEEFLSNTYHGDLPMLTYGLACATFPEEDSVDLTCNNEKCGKQIPHKYNMRSLLRVEKLNDVVKKKISSTVDNSYTVESSKAYASNAPVNKVDRVELPSSKFIVDFEFKSLADFKKIIVDQYNNNETVPRELTDIYGVALFVQSIYIPDLEDGGYYEYNEPLEIARALFSVDRIDLGIVYKQINKMGQTTNIEFGFMNVDCPHCKTHYNTLRADIDQVLFTRCQLEMNTIVE